MPLSPEIEEARRKMFELIGRNLLRFQKLEIVLKASVSGSKRTVVSDEMPPRHIRRAEEIRRSTLGMVAGEYFESVVVPQAAPSTEEKPILPDAPHDKICFQVSFRTELPPEEHARLEERLRKLVDERNRLVHGFLLQFRIGTADECRAAIRHLEDQAQRIAIEFDFARTLYVRFEEGRRELMDYIQSEHFITEVFLKNPDPKPGST